MSNAATKTINLVGAFGNEWGAEHHVLNALRELGHEVAVFDHRRGQAQEAVDSNADLTLVLRADGIPADVIRRFPRPTVLWYGELIHPSPDVANDISSLKAAELDFNVKAFDYVCHQDHTALDTIRELGARRVFWVPNNGVSADFHGKLDVPKTHDIGFAGVLSPRRVRILNALQERGVYAVFKQVYGEEFNHFISECRVFLNIHFTDLPSTETRLHEVLGAGTFALSEMVSMPEMFTDGKHLAYWRHADIDDLEAKIGYYLAHDDEREDIAAAGHRLVHSEYTYAQRCRELLETVEAAGAATSPTRPASPSPDRPGRRSPSDR